MKKWNINYARRLIALFLVIILFSGTIGGFILKPSGDFDIIDMRESATLKNGIIDVSGIINYTHACIVINGVHFINTREYSTKIFNMELQSYNQKGTGIYFHVDGDEQAIGWVRCNIIRTESFEYGIHLNCSNKGDSYGSWINGNTFSDLRCRNDKYFIYIQRNTYVKEPWSASSGNIFETIQYQTTKNTECVIYNEGWGNMFSNLMLWDWHLAGEEKTSIEFTSATRNCYLSFRGGTEDLIDNGVKNTIIDYGTSTIVISSIQSYGIFLSYLQILILVGLLVLVSFIIFARIKRKFNS